MYGFDGKRLYVSHRFSCPKLQFFADSTWIIAVLGPVTGRIESRRLWSSLLKPSHQISTSTSVYDSMNTECIVLGQYHVCLARYNASSKIIEASSSNHQIIKSSFNTGSSYMKVRQSASLWTRPDQHPNAWSYCPLRLLLLLLLLKYFIDIF